MKREKKETQRQRKVIFMSDMQCVLKSISVTLSEAAKV